jgi:hypothetical protein
MVFVVTATPTKELLEPPSLLVREVVPLLSRESGTVQRHIDIHHISKLHTPLQIELSHRTILPRRRTWHHRQTQMVGVLR